MGLAGCQAQERGCHPTDHGALAEFYAEENLIKGIYTLEKKKNNNNNKNDT